MAGLIAVLALALAPAPPAHPWACSRRFQIGDSNGSVFQSIAPGGTVSAIGFIVQKGVRREEEERFDWSTPESGRLAAPLSLSAWIPTAPADQLLWVRFWGDGRYVGQQLLVDHWLLRHNRGGTRWEISLHDPAILGPLMEAERWEVEAVGRDGRSYGRRALTLPSPSAVRAAYDEQAAWLAQVIRTRADPCWEVDPDDTGSI